VRIYGQIHGSKELQKLMGRLGNLGVDKISEGLLTCAYNVHRDAVASISRGPWAPGGGVYPRQKGKKLHQASGPGGPLRTDTGFLVQNIYVKLEKKGAQAAVAWVGTDVWYGKYWELHPTAARPWLYPAFEKNRQRNIELMKRAAADAVAAELKKGAG
jgi:hypothetical protein